MNEKKDRVNFLLKPICSEKKSNRISMSVSVVNLKENCDVIGHVSKLMMAD